MSPTKKAMSKRSKVKSAVKSSKKAAKKAVKKSVKKVAKKPAKKPRATGRKPRASEELHTHRLRGTLFYKMKSAHAETEAASARVQLLTTHILHEQQKIEYQPLIKMMQSRDEAHHELISRQREFAAVQLEAANKVGIPSSELNQWGYDTESGVFAPPGPPPKKG